MKLMDSERREFAGLFVQLLRDTFAGRIDDYTGEQVFCLAGQHEERFGEVKRSWPAWRRARSSISDWRRDSTIGLRTDVIIDGASITGNYHPQFTSINRDLSYAELVKRMKDKTLAVKAFETTTAP
jgi:phospholipid transport system substrate-binding protein